MDLKRLLGVLSASTIIFCLLVGLAFSNTLRIDFTYPETYCNCDDDCEGIDGCLSYESNSYLLTLNGRTKSAISSANNHGFKGVCAKLMMDSNQVSKVMTSDCSKYGNEEVYEAENDSGKTGAESEAEVDEEEIKNIISIIENSEDSKEKEESGEKIATPENHNSAEASEIEEAAKEEKNEYDAKTKTANEKNEKKIWGVKMSAEIIIAITVTIVSFFALMGWMAYLLQKRR